MLSATLPGNNKVWVAFGTEKNFRYLAAHQMAASLGTEKSLALNMFHALTGCDTVSGFVGHGKKTAWTIWNLFPDLNGALLELAHAPAEISEQCMHIIERFVILIYDRKSTCTDVNQARKKLRICKDILCKENFTNTRCSGAACEVSCLPRWSCLGTVTCLRSYASFLKVAGVGSRQMLAYMYMSFIGPHFKKH